MAECKCKRMARLLRKLGAMHAASMHAKIGARWSGADWLAHFDEEERYVLPELRRAGMTRAADRIEEEHAILRAQIRRYGQLSDRTADEHAAYEDDVVLRLEPILKKDRRPYLYASRKSA